jgi:hypothetical protein
LSKDQSERDSQKQRIEEEKPQTREEEKSLNGNQEKTNEIQKKTKHYCAINEKELNKVELAFFKRPNNTVILSDK